MLSLETEAEQAAQPKFQPLSLLRNFVPYKARRLIWAFLQFFDMATDFLVVALLFRGLRCGPSFNSSTEVVFLAISLLFASVVGASSAYIQFKCDSKKVKWTALRILIEDVGSFTINTYLAYNYLDGYSYVQIVSICFSFIIILSGILTSIIRKRELWKNVVLLVLVLASMTLMLTLTSLAEARISESFELKVNGVLRANHFGFGERTLRLHGIEAEDLLINGVTVHFFVKHHHSFAGLSVVNTANRELVKADDGCNSTNHFVVVWNLHYTAFGELLGTTTPAFAGVLCFNEDEALGFGYYSSSGHPPDCGAGWPYGSKPPFLCVKNVTEEEQFFRESTIQVECSYREAYDLNCTNKQFGEDLGRVDDVIDARIHRCTLEF